MSEKEVKKPRRPIRVSTLTGTLVILAVIMVFAVFRVILAPDVAPLARRVKCHSNMKLLFLSLAMYAQDHGGAYPTPERWCDSLVEWTREDLDDPNAVETLQKAFSCPAGPEGRCHYALNANADPCSAGDVVLLFESRPGWNQSAGPELLSVDDHKGCNVVLVDGSIAFVKAEEASGLRWADERTLSSKSRNARRPESDDEQPQIVAEETK